MTVGNLMIGEKYIEPTGTSKILNQTTMETCVVSYKSRGWSNQNSYKIEAEIKDAKGEPKIRLNG
jgi:oxysterol-binding protein 1